MFIKEKDCAPVQLENGTVRTIKGYLEDLMVVEIQWKKGQEGAVHSHPHRQCGYIISGTYEVNVDGEKQVLGPNECFYVEADVPHGMIALEDGVTLDVFTPHREDFL